MTFIQVDNLPERRGRKDLRGFLKEFMTEDIKMAKINLNVMDYKCPRHCYNALHTSIKTGGFPIKVHMRNDEIYLVRTDL